MNEKNCQNIQENKEDYKVIRKREEEREPSDKSEEIKSKN